MRVVSLLPSATEALCAIGGESLLVGRSHECDYPVSITDRPALTAQLISSLDPAEIDRQVSQALAPKGQSQGSGDGSSEAQSFDRSLYRLDVERLRDLAPDVILTQDLCDVCSIDLRTVHRVAAGMTPRPEVVSLNPQTFEGVLDDLMTIGRAVEREQQAGEALVGLRERFFRAADHVNAFTAPSPVLFLEWTDPPFVGGHWTPQLIERAGGRHDLNPTRAMENAGAGAGGQMAHRTAGKSMRVTPEAIAASAPEHVIVCPCGIALADMDRHLAPIAEQEWWRGLPAVKNGRVALVDGSQMFNRPGPRLVDAYEWLVGWLNDRPELIPAGFPWRSAAAGR